jgi:hypothetical protein
MIRGNTIDEKWSNLTYDIHKIVTKSFPEKTSTKNYKFEMSRGLMKSKNKKNKLLTQVKRGIIDKEVYVRYNTIYRKLIAKEQEDSFRQRLVDSGENSKKMESFERRVKIIRQQRGDKQNKSPR